MIMLLIFHSFVILTILKICSCQSQAGQKQSGNYDIKLTYIEPCEKRNDTVQMGFFNTRMTKNNRTHTCINGLYLLPYGLNDDMQVVKIKLPTNQLVLNTVKTSTVDFDLRDIEPVNPEAILNTVYHSLLQESWELFSKGSTGGWKRFMTFKNKKACSDKKRLFPGWFKLLKLQNVSCPIPPGNYTIDCHNLTGWKFSMAKTLTYGEYKAIANFIYKNENIGCTDFKGEIVPVTDEAK